MKSDASSVRSFAHEMRRAPLVGALVVAAGLAAAAVVNPVLAQPGPPAATGITLPERAHRGQDAIDRLGNRLENVARWYGKSANHLAHMLRTDQTLWVDKAGKLLYVEDVPPAALLPGKRKPQGGATATGTPTLAAAIAPLDQTFNLQSRPGAKRTLYLDFNGHTASGTVWNSSYGINQIVSPAFDLDGNPSSWSADELTAIQYVWMRVAEDYAPFDVNVTTADPGDAALTRSSSTDDVYGFRAVITRDFTAATSSPCGCGGFSYVGVVGSTNNAYYMPSYIFFDQLGSNEKYIADALSHEVGHALGLSHDGTSTSPYYWGQGSGVTSWAPIMGVGYNVNVSQWSKGDYPNANNKEDDIAIIGQNFPLRGDDVGDSYAQSRSLTATTAGGVSTLSGAGVVGSGTDVDVFNFYAAPGTVSFNVTGTERGTNVDLLVEIRDGQGRILASANPADSLNASVSATIAAAGQYYLVVTGVATPDTSTGYVEYGSIGQYWISGQAGAVAGTPPVAVVGATPTSGTGPLTATFSSSGSYDPDGSIVTYEWNFGDGSPLVYAPGATYTYSSPGTYTASLRVVDNAGLSSSAPVTIVVSQPLTVQKSRVNNIVLGTKKFKNGTTEVSSSVTVTDANGLPLAGATVSGSWSGSLAGSGSAVTGTNGVATIKYSRVRGTGTATFTVGNVNDGGYVYDPSLNVESVDTIYY